MMKIISWPLLCFQQREARILRDRPVTLISIAHDRPVMIISIAHDLCYTHVQVGACLVDASGKVVGTGYNGLPDACSDDDFPWTKDKCNPDSEIKHVYGKLIPANVGHFY